MTQTLTLPRRRGSRKLLVNRQATKSALRDIAYVLYLAERLADEIRGQGRAGNVEWRELATAAA
jgi:hypothetical protein